MSVPVENCFISLTTNFLHSIFLNSELPPPPKKNRCKVQKNVGKNWDERGWGITYVCAGRYKIQSRCWALVPVQVITLGIRKSRDSTGLTLLFRINNIPALFCWRVFDYVVCAFLSAVHGFTPFLVYILYPELYRPGTRLLLRIPNAATDNGHMKTWRIEKGWTENSLWVTLRSETLLNMPAVLVAVMRYNQGDTT